MEPNEKPIIPERKKGVTIIKNIVRSSVDFTETELDINETHKLIMLCDGRVVRANRIATINKIPVVDNYMFIDSGLVMVVVKSPITQAYTSMRCLGYIWDK